MGHSRAEKEQSRQRILAAAATRIREDGLDGVSVSELMKSVNLTHGGFYGHFESRDAMIAAALAQALEDGKKAASASHDRKTVKSIVNSYLSPAHRDHPTTGCAIPTLAGEVVRAGPEVRTLMAKQLSKSFEMMGEALGEEGPNTEQFAVTAWSTMVGAMIISRIMKDDPMGDQVLALARKSILELERLHGAKAG